MVKWAFRGGTPHLLPAAVVFGLSPPSTIYSLALIPPSLLELSLWKWHEHLNVPTLHLTVLANLEHSADAGDMNGNDACRGRPTSIERATTLGSKVNVFFVGCRWPVR